MGFFDTLKVMKDIVKGGIASYESGEKLDELIDKSAKNYKKFLSDDEKNLYKKYLSAKESYEENFSDDENNKLLEKFENCQVEYLEALQKNSSLPQNFRDEIKNAVAEFKKANNMALESLGETLTKYAENDEEKAAVKKVIEDEKRK